ncbi:hypothetical protein ACLOJK_011316 [Asimina triloba]
MSEGKVAADPCRYAIDAPGGFLFEWWSVFWDIFIARTNEKHSEVAAAYIEAQQIKAREHQQQLQMQQLQIMQQRAQLQRRDGNHPSLSGPINAIISEGMLGQSTASVLAAKMYEERMKNPHSMESEPSPQLLDASRMALLKSAANHPGQLVQGNPGSVALQQIQARTQQTIDIKGDVNMGATQRSLPMEQSSIYGQGVMQSKPGLGNTGLNQGGIDQLRPNLGPQVQKPFLQTPNQFQVLTPQQQQLLAQAQGSLGSPPSFGDMDPRRLKVVPRGGLPGKDGQPTGNDGSIGSPMQSNSPKVRGPQDQAEILMKNNKKRRPPSSSGPANSTGTGNTVGPSNSAPSTPSTHTPGDGVSVAANLPHVNSMTKSSMMYVPDGTAGLASSSNQLEDMEHFGDVGSLDDNVESFLSHDEVDAKDIFGALKRSPTEQNTDSSKGFSFSEVGSICTSSGKVVCCHFSSDGKLLASAGHEKKVAVLWNMDTLETVNTPEEHSLIVTDVRFRPNSTQLATSSFDRTIRLWNAAEGGTQQVRFQPRSSPLLAVAAENLVSVLDIEKDRQILSLQGHARQVNSICWDVNGDYIASVSQDSVRVWSLSGGECVHELSSNGNQFHSCIFHPCYRTLLVIGGYQTLELWNMAENKTMTVAAHDGLIVALASSPVSGMVASASHDKSVKLWK